MTSKFDKSVISWCKANPTHPDSILVVESLLATATLYEYELIEEPHSREEIISNVERQKENLLLNILGER